MRVNESMHEQPARSLAPEVETELAGAIDMFDRSYGPDAGAGFAAFAAERVKPDTTVDDLRGIFSDYMRVLYPTDDAPIGQWECAEPLNPS